MNVWPAWERPVGSESRFFSARRRYCSGRAPGGRPRRAPPRTAGRSPPFCPRCKTCPSTAYRPALPPRSPAARICTFCLPLHTGRRSAPGFFLRVHPECTAEANLPSISRPRPAPLREYPESPDPALPGPHWNDRRWRHGRCPKGRGRFFR